MTIRVRRTGKVVKYTVVLSNIPVVVLKVLDSEQPMMLSTKNGAYIYRVPGVGVASLTSHHHVW